MNSVWSRTVAAWTVPLTLQCRREVGTGSAPAGGASNDRQPAIARSGNRVIGGRPTPAAATATPEACALGVPPFGWQKPTMSDVSSVIGCGQRFVWMRRGRSPFPSASCSPAEKPYLRLDSRR
jgi:hypothetical protein